MKGQRGLTILELMVTISAIGAASLAFVTAVNGLHREQAVSRAYCDDLRGMRQALRLLREDLRCAESLDGLAWSLDGGRLRRGGRVVARNVREFEVKADGEAATARLVIGGRRALPVGDGVELKIRVRMRNAGRKR